VFLVRAALIPAALLALFPLLDRGPAPCRALADDVEPPKDEQLMGGSLKGRVSAESRARLVKEGGGNEASEAAVALGLRWLALHQANDGHWSLQDFHRCARERPGARIFTCTCGGPGQRNDTAATAFALLPFLGAGITPKSDGGWKDNHRKVVEAGLTWLVKHQAKSGDLGGGMYAHGLGTITLCEAYALSEDAAIKTAAQKAIDFIVAAQDPTKNGWRYTPRAGADTSVTGWQVAALKSGQMAGLKVPRTTFAGAEKWLDSVQTEDGSGYGYIDNKATPTMTAVGLLCRLYQGWSPRKAGLVKGVETLSKHVPGGEGEVKSMYFNYYATQVMHHMGGDNWTNWNPRMRDKLVKAQDQGKDEKHAHQAGSWDPKDDTFGEQGGRIMQTSLSLLTLEVYYRHVPLYGRDGADKEKD
jgi:hypothetical protein